MRNRRSAARCELWIWFGRLSKLTYRFGHQVCITIKKCSSVDFAFEIHGACSIYTVRVYIVPYRCRTGLRKKYSNAVYGREPSYIFDLRCDWRCLGKIIFCLFFLFPSLSSYSSRFCKLMNCDLRFLETNFAFCWSLAKESILRNKRILIVSSLVREANVEWNSLHSAAVSRGS